MARNDCWLVKKSAVSSSSVICQTTGPKPLPKRFLHIVRSRASSFNWQYPVLSLRSSSSFLRLLHLLVTSICPCIFPSITCSRRQFLRKMWPIQLAFRFVISCRIFLCSLTLSNTSSFLTWSVQLIFSILLQHHISKLSRRLWSVARSVQVSLHYKIKLVRYGIEFSWRVSCVSLCVQRFAFWLNLKNLVSLQFTALPSAPKVNTINFRANRKL